MLNVENFFNNELDDSDDIEEVKMRPYRKNGNIIFALTFYGEVFKHEMIHEDVNSISAAIGPYKTETMILHEILKQIPKEYHYEIITKIL